MKDNKKKIILISIVIIVLISLVIGISYAYWKVSKQQNTNNNISTLSCLNLEIIDVSDAISLTNASPITDEDAEGLKPYEFKVINTCETNTSYSINLEVMEVENRLNSNYVAAILDNGEKEILGNKIQMPKNYNGNDYTSVEAYNLGVGYVVGGEEKTHSLRIWIDENAADKNDAMSKKFISKIVITGDEIKEPVLAITLNGESTDKIPEKGDYEVTVDCGSVATGEWDKNNWNLKLTNINSSEIACNIDFKELEKLVKYITNLATTSEEIIDDETVDHNLRYIGADPNNYVSFNNELWRVIGVMNDVADENGKVEPRVKLIRSESIGDFLWDFKCGSHGTSHNNNYGSNNIIDSQLIMILNPITRIPEGYSIDENNYLIDARYQYKIMRSPGSYYNRTIGYKYVDTTSCYSQYSSSFTSVDFSNIGLTSESRNMISAVIWKMGGVDGIGDVSAIYVDERSSNTYEKNPIEWTGEVGLMYTSDYVYSTSADAKDCYIIYNWSNSGSICSINSWLYIVGKNQWLMTPRYTSDYQVMMVNSSKRIGLERAKTLASVRPVVYLNTNLKITSGTGTSSDPFQLKI